MRKLNYLLNENNVISSYTEIPFDETLPYIEIDDQVTINVGLDKVINGELISATDVILKQNRILELKELLAKTDYLCLKFTDGALSEEEYAPVRKQRQAYRDEINEIELELN